MIPSFYRAADLISEQIPTAAPFVDFDQDGFPDRAIGRWPVRDLEQLKNVVNKSLRWHAQDSHKSSQTSLFIADINESFNNFTSSSERIISVSYTHLRAHETSLHLVCRLLLEKKK